MITFMPRRAALIGAFAAAVFAPVAQAQPVNLSGSYKAEGRNPDGSAYTGRAVIGHQGDKIQINWTVGNQTYAGSGIVTGQIVMIDWGNPTPVVYVVMPNGALHGTWNDGTALERLTPQ